MVAEDGGQPAEGRMVNLAPTMRVVVTGGAGFVGANLGISLAERHPEWELVAYDNLYRRGSELNLPRLDQAGITFVKGDVRDLEELSAIEGVDALIECSAEPSVLAGADGETAYTVHTNLMGAYNCLEICRRDGSQLVFLSTSRVYPMRPQSELAYNEGPTRFELSDDQKVEGASPAGISEDFPLDGARSLYGATKLAAELLIEEYAAGFGLRTVIDRCGVITGPWQMGKVDQGVFAFWLFHHHFGLPLSYIGYGGEGKQVRDLLHIDDLVELVDEQLGDPGGWAGFVGNVGGGRDHSLSLLETTEICRELTGNEVPIERVRETRRDDVPIFIADCARLFKRTDWRPRRDPRRTLSDIHDWTTANESSLADTLGLDAAARVS
jgi:CDP-paratose 2-epimerase